MTRMRIAMPNLARLSDIEIVEKQASLAQAAEELKAYRVELSKDLDRRQGLRPKNMGTNPVIVKMQPAKMKARGGRRG